MDGSCSFCQWTRAMVEPYDVYSRLRFLNYNESQVAVQAPFSRSDLDQEMHVRTPEGTWLRGFEAWLAILRVLPRFVWLGRIASLPPFRWLGPPVYAFVARYRYSLPGAPARCEGDTCPAPSQRPK
jgi:predicted DCC family thiol-disulfide oxidoreductase YuxK